VKQSQQATRAHRDGWVLRRLALVALLVASSCREPRQHPFVATTTSVENTGLLEAVRAAFSEQTGSSDASSFRERRFAWRGAARSTSRSRTSRAASGLHASGRAVSHRAFENRFLSWACENPAGIETG
jgi:hypothetical protein